MTEKARAYLCIGGPYDGRRYASKRELGFQVPKLVRRPQPYGRFNAAIAPVAVETITYIADRVRCADSEEEVWFWRPADQSITATMHLLLERYEQANNVVWSETPFPN
jgi:hypothetical protein